MSAPILASRLLDGENYRIEGAVVVGTGTTARGQELRRRHQRVLFVVVPPRRPGDGVGRQIHRDDQWNRQQAEESRRRLTEEGVTVHLRHIPSARRHTDWHWGLISPCRYFPDHARVDAGRGYWPNYWIPNPQTAEVISAFIAGDEPPILSEQNPSMFCPNGDTAEDARM